MTISEIDKGLSVLLILFAFILFFIPSVIYGLCCSRKMNKIRLNNLRRSALTKWPRKRHIF